MRGKAQPRFLAALLALVVGIPAVARATAAGITVKPRDGTPTTRFVVHFTAPQASGRTGGVRREYILNASGPRGATHCRDTISVIPPTVKAHARVRVTLKPSAMAWCLGRWTGTVEELESPVCPPLTLCPAFVAVVRRLGPFHFRVHASRTQGIAAPV